MGADFYESPGETSADQPPIGIGHGSVIEGAIVDKNCRIGPRVRIINDAHLEDASCGELCTIRDGILVVSKEAVLPADWYVETGQKSG
jgi:glucose-1-phosphate adenylyltransferase